MTLPNLCNIENIIDRNSITVLAHLHIQFFFFFLLLGYSNFGIHIFREMIQTNFHLINTTVGVIHLANCIFFYHIESI